MGTKDICVKPWAAYAGFLQFNCSAPEFNDLHVTFTTAAANCGKGFHFTAYKSQLVGTHQPQNVIGRIYFTVDEKTGIVTKGREDYNYNVIVNNFLFASWQTEARDFYLELFEIRIAVAVKDDEFPAFPPRVTHAASAIAQPQPQPSTSAPPFLPNPMVAPSGAAVGNPEFFARLSKSLDYSKGYSLF